MTNQQSLENLLDIGGIREQDRLYVKEVRDYLREHGFETRFEDSELVQKKYLDPFDKDEYGCPRLKVEDTGICKISLRAVYRSDNKAKAFRAGSGFIRTGLLSHIVGQLIGFRPFPKKASDKKRYRIFDRTEVICGAGYGEVRPKYGISTDKTWIDIDFATANGGPLAIGSVHQ